MTDSFDAKAAGRAVRAYPWMALALWMGACAAMAQSASAPQMAVPAIVVTAAREPMPLERVAGDVTVIDADTIRNSAADSLGDLLRREAGLQLTRAGGPGQGTAALIRGANGGQTVVLVDGVRVGSATLGLTALEQIGLAEIERIEVLKGPGSSLYGADAIGGVVNIFTRRAEAGQRLSAQWMAGGLGSQTASASWGRRTSAWEVSVSASHEASDGVSVLRPGDQWGNYNPDRDGYALRSLHAQWALRPHVGQEVGLMVMRTRLNSQYDASEYAPPKYLPNPMLDFRNRAETEVAAAHWKASWSGGFNASVRAAWSRDDAIQGATQPSQYQTDREQLSAQLGGRASSWGRWVAALDSTQEKAQSTSYVGNVSRRIQAATIGLSGSAGAGSWQAEVRRDNSSDYGGVTTARLGQRWVLSPRAYLRVLAGSTFRAPSFNDLVFPGYGVAGLRPERGRSIEAALGGSSSGFSGELSLFQNRVTDLIGYESDRSGCPPDPSYDYGCARNISQARLQGVSLKGRWQEGPWALQAGWEFLDAKDTTTGSRLPRRAAQQGHVKLEHTVGTWSWGAQMLHLGARPDAGKQLAAQTTLDLQARWRFRADWELQIKALNLTDVDTEPSRDFQGFGRQMWVGLRYAM